MSAEQDSSSALTELEAGLSDPSWHARAAAVEALARRLREGANRREQARISQAFASAARDPKWEVRLAVARAAGALRGEERALDGILQLLLQDGDARVVRAAHETLSQRDVPPPGRRSRRTEAEDQAQSILHDMRSTCSSQQRALALLEDELRQTGQLTAWREEQLRIAGARGQRMLEVAEVNLRLSLAAPRRLRELPLLPLVREAWQDARDAHPHTAQKVSFSAVVDERLAVKTHGVQLVRALTNVFVNAIEAFRGAPGTITVSASVEEERVRLEVADDGPGMKPAMLEALGSPGKTTKTRTPEGPVCGYGFAGVRKAIRDCRGEVEPHSQAGSGTTIVFRLPLAPQAEEGAGP